MVEPMDHVLGRQPFVKIGQSKGAFQSIENYIWPLLFEWVGGTFHWITQYVLVVFIHWVALSKLWTTGAWGPFLESSETFRAHFPLHLQNEGVSRLETLQLFLFLFSLQHMKRSALQNKQVGGLRMAFRARKGFGTFEKRAPSQNWSLFWKAD